MHCCIDLCAFMMCHLCRQCAFPRCLILALAIAIVLWRRSEARLLLHLALCGLRLQLCFAGCLFRLRVGTCTIPCLFYAGTDSSTNAIVDRLTMRWRNTCDVRDVRLSCKLPDDAMRGLAYTVSVRWRLYGPHVLTGRLTSGQMWVWSVFRSKLLKHT